MPIRVLVVDDDEELCELLTTYLQPEGFVIDSAHDAESGVQRALEGCHSLVILDVMLPGFSGFDVLRKIRGQSDVPVLMLTARGEDVDRIVGLEIGADDYLPKPFNPRELVARTRAILRRSGGGAVSLRAAERLRVGDVAIDVTARVARRGDTELTVTSLEFDLLCFLVRHAGSVVDRQQLSTSVLQRGYDPLDRSIDMHICNLRKKMQGAGDQTDLIKTVRGVGYLFALPGNDGSANGHPHVGPADDRDELA